MVKVLKVISIILLAVISAGAALFVSYLVVTKDAVLDSAKLQKIENNVIICDEDGKEIINATVSGSRKSVKVEQLNELTVNAFIASEDRTFFRHNGLNYARILKALYKNVTTGSFKEGASTISQQLIKNTHLTGDKTIKRKLNEIRLTKKLEKNYEKDDILEMYLNTIYFGHNCYGLESAAEFYFDKRAEELNLNESATLVGLLSSPNNYSPFKNMEKSVLRRNIVLNAMQDCGYIDKHTCEKTKTEPINAVKAQENGKFSNYITAVFDELEEMEIDFYDILKGCKITTYLNQRLQNYIENLSCRHDNSVIVTSREGGVCAYVTTTNGARRQPASTIKPIAVYAPAIEEKLLTPYTKIPDEKIDYNGYSPENFDKKYHGLVSVADCVKYSYNVPAVKTLNALTIAKAEKYLNKMNLKLENEDKNLPLALGGMKFGLTIKELADCYSTFANRGNFSPSQFIKQIELANGTKIICGTEEKVKTFSEGTCSLINEMLMDTAKSGTAKKLKDLNFNVAAKTGTGGNSEGNTDAYAIGYTSDRTVAVWLGDKNNQRLNITGGGESCEILRGILDKIYENATPAPLDTTSGTAYFDIDLEEYENNNRLILADELSPAYNVKSVKLCIGGEPKEKSTKFSKPAILKPRVYVTENTVNIKLCQAKYYAYIVKRYENDNFEVVYNGKWKDKIADTPQSGVYTYSVTPYYSDENVTSYGPEIKLDAVKIGNSDEPPQVKIPGIVEKDWFNM